MDVSIICPLTFGSYFEYYQLNFFPRYFSTISTTLPVNIFIVRVRKTSFSHPRAAFAEKRYVSDLRTNSTDKNLIDRRNRLKTPVTVIVTATRVIRLYLNMPKV